MLYGEADAEEHPLPDGLHPDVFTHRRIGRRFASLALRGARFGLRHPPVIEGWCLRSSALPTRAAAGPPTSPADKISRDAEQCSLALRPPATPDLGKFDVDTAKDLTFSAPLTFVLTIDTARTRAAAAPADTARPANLPSPSRARPREQRRDQ